MTPTFQQQQSRSSPFASPFFSGAAEAAASLHPNVASNRAPSKVASAFEVLGVPSPSVSHQVPDQAERFIAALTGDRRSIPTWNGQPNTLRTWLKMLAYWEIDNPLPRVKWGIKLYQSLQEDSEARRLADQFELKDLMSPDGYSLVLSAIMEKYRPYLEVAVPAAIDRFFYGGEKQKGQSFAAYIAQKETSKIELENHLQEKLSTKIAGRILLRQAGLTEYQRELLALRDYNTLLSFEQVAALLRPLDRPELIAQAAGAELGSQAQKHYPVVGIEAPEDDEGNQLMDEEGENEESEYYDSEMDDLEEGEVFFEDREYQEDEAQYIQAYHSAYADVRASLRDQRKQRGFSRPRPKSPSSSSRRPRSHERGGKGKDRGKGRSEGSRFNKQRTGPFSRSGKNPVVKGTSEDLLARTRCYNCQELGHLVRDCPLKGAGKGAKRNFVICRGGSGDASISSNAAFLLYKGRPEAVSVRQAYTTCTAIDVESLSRIFAGVKVKGFEALVDTAAEDGVIGDRALQQMTTELKKYQLQPVEVKSGAALPCAGIGGAATIVKTVDIATSVAGQQGVLRMTVLQDSDSFATPPLLPISYLEAVRAIIDLSAEELRLPGGLSTPMTRLSSGHRAVDILNFQEQQWQLPDEFRVDGRDPFQIVDTTILATTTPCSSRWQVLSGRVWSQQDAYSTVHCAAEGPGIKVFVHLLNGDIRLVCQVHGWRPQQPVSPAECCLGEKYRVSPDRYAMILDQHGHFMHVNDKWNAPAAALQYPWRGRVFFFEESEGPVNDADSLHGGPGAPSDDSAFQDHGSGSVSGSRGGGSVGQKGQGKAAFASSGGHTQSRQLYRLASIEELAKQLNATADYSEAGLMQLVKMFEKESKNCRNMLKMKSKHGYTVVLGAFVHGGVCGVTSLTMRLPEMCRYVNSWLRHHAAREFDCWSSVHIGVQVSAPPHTDKNNELNTHNMNITIGEFQGGEMWLEKENHAREGGRDVVERVVGGQRRAGYLIDTHMKPYVFNPKQLHASSKWSGFRISITAYSIRSLPKMSPQQLECLVALGFPCRTAEERVAYACHFVGDHEDDQEAGHACEQDFDEAFEQVQNRPPAAVSMIKRMLHSVSRWIFNSNPRPARPARSHGKPSRASFEDGRERALGREDAAEPEDGISEDPSSVEANGYLGSDPTGHSSSTNCGGPHGDPQRRDARAGGEERQEEQDREEGEAFRPDQSGDWSTVVKEPRAQGVPVEERNVQPPRGCLAVPGKRVGKMVDVHKVRFKVEPAGRDTTTSPIDELYGNDCGRRGPKACGTEGTGVSEISSSPAWTSGTRSTRSHFECGRESTVRTPGGGDQRPSPHGASRSRETSAEDQQVKGSSTSSFGTSRSTASQEQCARIEESDRMVRDELRRDQDGLTDDPRLRRRARCFVIDGNAVASSSEDFLRRFAEATKKRGIILKAFVVLFSVAGGDNLGLNSLSHTVPRGFGRPMFEGIWNPEVMQWTFDNEPKGLDRSTFPDPRSTFPDPSSTFSDPSSTFPDPSSTFPDSSSWSCSNDFQEYQVRAYLFRVGEAMSWLSDLEGASCALSKGEKCNLVHHLQAQTGRSRSRGQTESQGTAKVIDLSRGWDFDQSQHRREALRLVSKHRPALVWLGSDQQFASRLAEIQDSGGRGFVMTSAFSTTSSPETAPPVTQRKNVFEIQWKTSPPRAWAWTNVPEVAKALQRRCDDSRLLQRLQAFTINRQLHLLPVFVDNIVENLHRLQPSRHYPIFNMPDPWFRRGGHLRCQHFVPRRRQAVPAECTVFSTTTLRFTGRRTTHQQFVDGRSQMLHDDWRQDFSTSTTTAWTGYTEFEVLPSLILPDDYKSSALWVANAAAHALHTFVSYETDFQTEWQSMFPSHRILGERRTSGAPTFGFADPEFDVDEFIDNIPNATENDAKRRRTNGEDEQAVARELRELPVPDRAKVEVSSLPPDLRREVYRIHRNLGHPERAAFCRALKHAGATAEVIQYAKHVFQCPICLARKRPASHRPAHLVRAMAFNEVVGADLIFYEKKVLLNMLCWGVDIKWFRGCLTERLSQ